MSFEIGRNIKTLRLAATMTQEQLAQKLSVTPQAVSKWESGVSMPDIQLLPELSVLLGTSIDALFSMTDDSRMARIENMLWDRRFLTQQEFETEERFLRDKCLEQPRAALLLAQLYNKRAVEYHEHAAPLARRALSLQPDCKDAHHAVFDAEGGPQYLEALDRVEHTYHFELYRGMICKAEGNLPEALACWARMTEEFPENWQAAFARASQLAWLCRYDEAAQLFEASLDRMPHPKYTDAAEALAQLCELRGDRAGAICWYERMIEIARTDWNEQEGEMIDAPQRCIDRLRRE